MFLVLKELRDKDFAVLGQFCAKIIHFSAFTRTQNAPVKL